MNMNGPPTLEGLVLCYFFSTPNGTKVRYLIEYR